MRSIVGLCKSLAIDCVVEGVSNGRQAEILREMGAPQMQGFHFSRAMTQAQLMKYLHPEIAAPAPAEAPKDDLRRSA